MGKDRPQATPLAGEGSGSTLVHNSRTHGHFIASKDDGGGNGGPGAAGESIPLDILQGGDTRRLHRRRGTSPVPGEAAVHGGGSGAGEGEGEQTYIMHVIEPHHTLQGIALQYRVTVRTCPLFHPQSTVLSAPCCKT